MVQAGVEALVRLPRLARLPHVAQAAAAPVGLHRSLVRAFGRIALGRGGGAVYMRGGRRLVLQSLRLICCWE